MLLVLIAISSGYSLTGKFLADDFSNLKLLTCRPWEMLLSGFHGRHMYYPSFGEHYRPLLTIPHLLDVLAFGKNAAFFHLSNMVWHWVCSFLAYLSARELARFFSAPHPVCVALWAAMLFAVHPFHSENIGWWIAKNDIVFSTFYLAAFYCFLSARNKRIWSYIFFAISLCCKETALTLPFLLACFCAIHPRRNQNLLSCISGSSGIETDALSKPSVSRSSKLLIANLKDALFQTRFYWLILAAFWSVRTYFLGTLVGCYYGGETTMWWFQRFADFRNMSVLWYPVDFDAGPFSNICIGILGFCNFAIVACVLRDVLNSSQKVNWRVPLFLLAFTILSFFPSGLIWYPDTTLSGCRLLYLFSFPVCVIYSTAMLGQKISVWRQGLLALICLVFISSSVQAAIRWSAASNFAERLISQINLNLDAAKPESDFKLLVLNIPRKIQGVPLFNYFSLVRDAFKEPFYNGNAGRLFGLDPHFFADPESINRARIAEIARSPNMCRVVECRIDKSGNPSLVPIDPNLLVPDRKKLLVNSKPDLKFRLQPVKHTHDQRFSACTVSFERPVRGANYSLLKISLSHYGDSARKVQFRLFWKDTSMAGFDMENSKTYTYELASGQTEFTIDPGSLLPWCKCQSIEALEFFVAEGPSIESATLMTDEQHVPLLDLVEQNGTKSSVSKAQGIMRSLNGQFHFRYDAASIPRCAKVRVEVGPPQTNLNILKKIPFDCTPIPNERLQKSFECIGARGQFSISEQLGSPLWHYVRLLALDKDDNVVGFESAPLVVLSVSDRFPLMDLTE